MQARRAFLVTTLAIYESKWARFTASTEGPSVKAANLNSPGGRFTASTEGPSVKAANPTICGWGSRIASGELIV